MAAEQFLHGIETIEVSDGIRPIQTVRSSVIGIVGTAPMADPILFPLNKPVLIPGNPRMAASLGLTGTLPWSLDGIFDQIGAMVVVVRVEEGADYAATIANVLGNSTAASGVHALPTSKVRLGIEPRILIAPGFTGSRVDGGLLNYTITAAGTGYTSAPTVTFTGGEGTGAAAIAITDGDTITGITITSLGSGYTTPPTVALTGGGGTGAAVTVTIGSAANPTVAEMRAMAKSMRAVIIKDGPGTTDAAVITDRGDYGDDRVFIVDPMCTIFDTSTQLYTDQPSSARIAGLIARIDNEYGFWWSPSNKEIYGITGTSRPIDFRMTDPNSQSNYLNGNDVATIVRTEGFRLWGNRTTSQDPLWAFLSVRRTADMIYESVEQAMHWAIDRPITKNTIIEIQESTNAYIRHLANPEVGALLGGQAWIDPTINTKDQLVAGKLTIDFDIEPPAPIERLTFRAHRNPDYYEEVIDAVVRTIA